jgi:hypothetical protein
VKGGRHGGSGRTDRWRRGVRDAEWVRAAAAGNTFAANAVAVRASGAGGGLTCVMPHDEGLIVGQPAGPVGGFCFGSGRGELCGGECEQVGVRPVGRVKGVAELDVGGLRGEGRGVSS